MWRSEIKYGLLSSNFFQRAQKHGGGRDLRIPTNYHKNNITAIATISKQVATITYTVEKKFFEVANFEGL